MSIRKPLGCINCFTDIICQNLRQAYLLEVGMMQILTHHETISIISHVGIPCTLSINDNFFAPSPSTVT